MPEAPLTRPSLLIRIREFQNQDAWEQFVDVYAPLIYGFARKRGLQDADAADLTQVCLRRVAAHIGTLDYDPKVGTFRAWLFTIVRNRLRDFRDRRRDLASGNSGMQRLLEQQPAPEPDEADDWEREYRRSLLAWAAEQVKPVVQATTWDAFWRTAVEGKSGKDVAQELGMTPAAVYLAKNRVMARLRSLIHELQDEE